jgi:hypothetical protein
LGGNCFSAPKFPAVLGVPALQARAGAQIDPVTGLFATLEAATGTRSTGYQRLQSPPFSYALPASDNLYQSLFGIKVRGTVSPAAADGYWSFIPGTLAPGQYVLHFGGRSPLNAADPSAGSFIERITYHVTVTP